MPLCTIARRREERKYRRRFSLLLEKPASRRLDGGGYLPQKHAGCRAHENNSAGAHLSAPSQRPWHADQDEEDTMTRLISYKTKPEQAAGNAELVKAVFAELGEAKPEGLRYLTLRLDDDTFVHLVATEAADGTSALPQLAAFQAFQQGVRERCAEPPLVRQATVVGNYRMLDEH
jgi:hypothetical protein